MRTVAPAAADARSLPRPRGRPTLPPVRPSIGLRVDYEKRLHRLVAEMASSTEFRLRTAYRQNAPRVTHMAMDRLPAAALQATVRQLTRKWATRFAEAARRCAEDFVRRAARRVDQATVKALKSTGVSAKFTNSAAVSDALRASIEENVALIRSIPDQYFVQVQGSVMRAVQTGAGVEALTRDIRHCSGVTERRAALIAHDQLNKVTSVVTRLRQQESGHYEAVWHHPGLARHPRPSHVAASGKTYDVRRGMFLDGEWTWPGMLIGCGCLSLTVPVTPTFRADDGSD